jgi:ribulose-phosphate 3-epimerase
MKLHLGLKSDPIERRYSYEWLFDLMKKMDVHYLQLGGFFELLLLEDDYFLNLRENAEKKEINISSLFSSRRELSGFFSNNRYLEKTARIIYEKYIHVGSLLGVNYVGASIGPIMLDMLEYKNEGTHLYFNNMKDLMHMAKEKGLKGLTMEVMSCSIEFPTTPEEIDFFINTLNSYHKENVESTVPVYLLGDISHGYADRNENVVYSNYEIFEYSIPYMCEFHFKNTDYIFNETFGFSKEENSRGCVELQRIKDIIVRNQKNWPVENVMGYLEHPGPKLGRDYSDYKLENMLIGSIDVLKRYFV